MDTRPTDLRTAIQLSVVSVAWGGLAGIAALILAYDAGSLSLLGFGVDAVIDSCASVTLIWRFSMEGRAPRRADRVEHAAERIVGGILIAAALSLAVGAVRALVAHVEVATTIGAIVLLCASVGVLPPLAIAKRRVASRLGSRALRADSLLTAAGAVLAGVSLVSLLLATTASVWWADSVGAFIIAAL
ncbi:MAG TPA: cation transporter, partial [Candidatus Limnocylindrales bacterium]|nr:cation transporter [Candidatus Limnocylindrales bacterium]